MGKKTPMQRAKTRNPHMKATRRTANRHFRKVSIPNEAIKDAWDPKATMTENYQRLGLAMDANDSIDGSKKKKKQQPAAADSTLIQEIEELASHEVKVQRHMSEGEAKFVESLLKKYGDNVEAMTRDIKLNPYQQTAGELRRKIAKYQEQAVSS